jgi:hypothetical protein
MGNGPLISYIVSHHTVGDHGPLPQVQIFLLDY